LFLRRPRSAIFSNAPNILARHIIAVQELGQENGGMKIPPVCAKCDLFISAR
jgi:hypothetical protein